MADRRLRQRLFDEALERLADADLHKPGDTPLCEVLHRRRPADRALHLGRVGTVAGCRVTDGKLVRNAKVRVLRDSAVIAESELSSLKRFKDDAKEVAEGFDCGLTIDKFNDIKEGDVVEAFAMEEIRD